uniref:Uncharacterized protein n=1 Tax=Drosophila melanogaster TaxID=7227 RepID=M9NEY2_DROME|nr:uncharacterized protein Dmel_CG43198 [Drosophila melanogaster]AFH07275.1 uncharacterized protein Dmel_CG43198 [Drosophila melanogaster]|eukprot:NP_001245561.1 uncharacterized protein Dmel_CG43198 [Drosophila melanogaster]
MRCRLRKCCCIISLRVGCMISALSLFFFELIAVPMRNASPCCDTLESIVLVVYGILDMVHFVGCLMLFVASFVKTSVLVLIFLITSCLHIVLYPAFLVAEVLIWDVDIIDISISIIGLLLCIYFWIVAYAFYFKCKEEVMTDPPTAVYRVSKIMK